MVPAPDGPFNTQPPRRPQNKWDRIWPRIVSVVQALMGTVIGVNEALNGDGRPYVLAFSLLLFTGAPATEAMIRLLTRK